MFLKNPAQITKHISDDQGVGVSVPKPGGGHSPWLDVGVAVTSGDDQDQPAAEGTMVQLATYSTDIFAIPFTAAGVECLSPDN